MSKPIIMSAESVRAILDGRKTQTRRACRDQTAKSYQYTENIPTYPVGYSKSCYTGWAKDCGHSFLVPTKCPYGEVGDELWTKETWCRGSVVCGAVPEGESDDNYLYLSQCKGENNIIFKEEIDKENISTEEVRWKPSIYLPKEFACIWLEITGIRVEHLQDITNADCVKEGIIHCTNLNKMESDHFRFIVFWDSINAQKGYDWSKNPFCWVIEFKRITKGGK